MSALEVVEALKAREYLIDEVCGMIRASLGNRTKAVVG